jgi:two-component sensor histidine kinase
LECTVREKELLLRELHHRVKNNLQTIISLINLQSNRIGQFPELRAVCLSMKERIRAISLVHERMYRDSSTFHERLDFGSYLTDLVCGIAALFQAREIPPPVFKVGETKYQVSVEVCVDFGLVISELVTNAYKHAILPGQGRLEIELIEGENQIRLIIRDHGPGLASGTSPAPASLGMHIVQAILSKYNTVIESGLDGGAWVGFELPLGEHGLSVPSEGSISQ